MTTALTIKQFQQVLPAKMKKSINQELVDQINNTLEHPEMLANMRENLLSYTSVMNDGRFKIANYISAVKYCSFKFMGDTNLLAYTRAFPDKMSRFAADNISNKDISSYVHAYSKSKLVMLIMEQSMIPCYVSNNHHFQDAINTQAEIMKDPDVSPKVRSDAANSLMTHLKPPENKKIEIDVGANQGSVIEDYQQAMVLMVNKQKELIEAGGDLLSITNASIKKTEDKTIDITPKKAGGNPPIDSNKISGTKADLIICDDPIKEKVVDNTPLNMVP